MQNSKSHSDEAGSPVTVWRNALADVDHHIATYVIRNTRVTEGDGAVVKLITGRSTDGKTLLFGATPEKARLLLDELMKSGGRDEVATLIKEVDHNGNTALFNADAETARLLITRLYDTVTRRHDVFEFITQEDNLGLTVNDNSSPELKEVIRAALDNKMLRA